MEETCPVRNIFESEVEMLLRSLSFQRGRRPYSVALIPYSVALREDADEGGRFPNSLNWIKTSHP